MSFQANDETTQHNGGEWKKVDGKLVFVEESYMTSSEQNYIFGSSIHRNDCIDITTNTDTNTKRRSFASVVSSTHDTEVSNISANYDSILNKVKEIEMEIKIVKEENATLRKKVAKNKKEMDHQLDYIYTLEIDMNRLNQYGRRQNIEISGIPSTVRDQELENEVVKILNKMGLSTLDHYGIVGCHRIGKRDRQGNRNTIVRFLHRKDAIFILKNKRNARLCNELGYFKLNIIENLCPAFKSIFEEMKELKNTGIIAKVWTYNGHVNYKMTDNDQEKPRVLYHDSELSYFYN